MSRRMRSSWCGGCARTAFRASTRGARPSRPSSRRLELFQEACRIAVTTGHYVTAVVSFIEPGTRTARPLTWAGNSSLLMSSLVFSIAQRPEDDKSVTGRVLRTGEVFLCNDIAHADATVA